MSNAYISDDFKTKEIGLCNFWHSCSRNKNTKITDFRCQIILNNILKVDYGLSFIYEYRVHDEC